MNKKAIRILIVGGQGTGKTTLAKKIAEIIASTNVPGFSAKREARIVDEGVESFIRDEKNVANNMTYNTIEVYQESPNPVTSVVNENRVHTSLYINLTAGYIQDVHGYLPDELREPIMNAANEQIAWVNEHYPMRNGRLAFRAECEISEEAMKKVLDNAKIAGEEAQEVVGKAKPMTDEAVAKALKNLAQDLAKMAKRQQKRRELRAAIRSILILLTCAFFVVAIIMIARSGIDFLRALLAAITTGLLSSLFDND